MTPIPKPSKRGPKPRTRLRRKRKGAPALTASDKDRLRNYGASAAVERITLEPTAPFPFIPKPSKRGPKPRTRLRGASRASDTRIFVNDLGVVDHANVIHVPEHPAIERLAKAARASILRRKRPRRQRKSDTWGALRNKLDAAFSAYVKRRDGPICVTCKRTITNSRDWHAGHFHGRARMGTRWDFRNVHSQCGYVCNKVRRGAPREYALFIVATYGASEFERLARVAKVQKKWTRPEMQELLDALGRGDADFESFYAERYML